MKLTLLFVLLILVLVTECVGKKTLWFMATQFNEHAASYLAFVKAALNSALLLHSDQLFPVLMLGGSHHQNVPLPDWLTKLAESGTIHILHRNLTFVNREVINKYPILNHPAYLRLDIPTIVPELAKTLPPSLKSNIDFDYILYTDCDVLFYPSFNINDLPKPKVISLGGEMKKDEIANSGVLYMNIKGMRKHMAGFIEHGKNANFSFPVFDQGYLLSYFHDKLHVAELLPAAFNWKPYWGNSNKTAILHFHGMKPRRSAECFSNMDSSGCESPIVAKCVGTPIYVDICRHITNLYHVSPDDMSLSYASALRIYRHMVTLDVALKSVSGHNVSAHR
eukprot:scaffold8334_cov164-Ochromonas_danica.AAC.4